MTSYRYLGDGVTNSNGVAHLDHDPQGNPINGYTGTGAGEVDVIASTDNPVSSGSIVSETYSIWDTLFFDNCTDDSKSSMWGVYKNTVSTPVFDNTGALIERTSTGNGFLFVGQSNETDKPFPLDFAVEFDVVEITGDVRFIPDSGSWEGIRNMSANDHYKIEFYTDHQVITKNNGTPVSYEKTNSGSFKVQFMFVGVSSIKLKNVKVYSI